MSQSLIVRLVSRREPRSAGNLRDHCRVVNKVERQFREIEPVELTNLFTVRMYVACLVSKFPIGGSFYEAVVQKIVGGGYGSHFVLCEIPLGNL